MRRAWFSRPIGFNAARGFVGGAATEERGKGAFQF